MAKYNKLLFKLFILSGFIFVLYLIYNTTNKKSCEIEVQQEIKEDALSFKDSVYNYMLDLRIEHPHIVIAQAILETGNFTSDLAVNNNNLFGMKMPTKRATTAISVRKKHAVFNTWKESVIDYALYQTTYRRNLTESQYYDKLKTYAEDEKYIEKVKQLAKQFKEND